MFPVTTRLGNVYTNPQTGESDTFVINLTVNYREEKILYIPGFWYVIKWAWVQYFSVLVILMVVSNVIRDWVFKNQIVSTWVELPQKKIP